VMGFNFFGDTLRDMWDPKLCRRGLKYPVMLGNGSVSDGSSGSLVAKPVGSCPREQDVYALSTLSVSGYDRTS
jgi:hypothetical protein